MKDVRVPDVTALTEIASLFTTAVCNTVTGSDAVWATNGVNLMQATVTTPTATLVASICHPTAQNSDTDTC